MLKASSLLYAVFICFIISILTGSIVYLGNINNELSVKNEIENNLIYQCQSCLNYVLTISSEKIQNEENIDLLNNPYKCKVSTKKWGLMDVVETSAFFKKDTVSSTFFVGKKDNDSIKTALYLTDLNEKLKISGETKIKGNIFLPKKGYEITNILGNQQINNPKVTGKITIAKNSLPEIDIQVIQDNDINANNFSLSDIESNFNSFKNETIEIELGENETLTSTNLKGNFILKSNGSISISSSSNLEDIIIYANEINIEDGFNGTLQIYAKTKVKVGKNVSLSYPSAIIINNSIEYDKEIFIDENSKIYGGILINSNYQETEDNKITVEENSTIIGDIYCNGTTELKGNLTGSVYTNKFEYHTDYSSYSNLLLNVNIDSNTPNEFVNFPFLKNTTTDKKFEIIKKIQ